ncbi:MAG: transaldolase [Candidatus Deianiraeaceae bacterium]|jgi:transaldolase
MKIFLDTADINSIKGLNSLGIIDGVTTNPSIIAKSGKIFESVIEEICSIVQGPVSAEVISLDYDGMLKEANELIKIADNVCIKLPITKEGIKACKTLSDKGVLVNMTLCFSSQQALLVAKAGATFVSPFIGRLDDIGHNGLDLIEDIRQIFDNYEMETQILAASARNSHHFTECAKIGADVITMPPSVLDTLFKHPLTDKGLEIFMNDWKSIK